MEGRRQAANRLFSAFVYTCFAAAALPLLVIAWYTIQRGISTIGWKFLTISMFRHDPDEVGGGIYHAIIGTVEQSLLATVIAAPLGVLAAVYLVEYGGRPPFPPAPRSFSALLTSLP